MPAFTTALAFYDGYRSERLPANLLQAQRDYFGAHTYERIDQPRGKFFHTNWTGKGGNVSAGNYTVWTRHERDVTPLASRIRLLLMDVDGVLTDGKLYNVPGPDGKMAETKGFDSQDGIALQWMARLGIATGLISGRVSPATVERANQCKFKYIYQGHTEKIPILNEILADAKLDPSEVAYIGDDFTDVVVMRRVGLASPPPTRAPR